MESEGNRFLQHAFPLNLGGRYTIMKIYIYIYMEGARLRECGRRPDAESEFL